MLIAPSAFHNSWQRKLSPELEKEYFVSLQNFLENEICNGNEIFPEYDHWFNALNTTPLDKVKVVVLGQDPYPSPGHAHGLCFSVLPEVKPLPKSLINIYKELKEDLAIENTSGNLQGWAEQGVLLLNSVLTVQRGNANSHQGKGWEQFTDKIIAAVNDQGRPIVFVLWGAYAQKKGEVIDETKHLVIRSSHPSPLSAYRGFFGSKPFSKINDFLIRNSIEEINWQI
ncbi:MAG: uracil-DNA glycosylase [Gammaproteobacteria bacterium]|nr:uracil-DNA glycosylase [Gammaproteobacteria bacterium]